MYVVDFTENKFILIILDLIFTLNDTLLYYMSLYLFCFQDAEGENLAKIMMSKKTKRLYGRMQHGIEKKVAAVAVLEGKRKAIESESGAPVGTTRNDKKKGANTTSVKKQRKA